MPSILPKSGQNCSYHFLYMLSNVVGIICPLKIGLTDLPKTGPAPHVPPCPPGSAIPAYVSNIVCISVWQQELKKACWSFGKLKHEVLLDNGNTEGSVCSGLITMFSFMISYLQLKLRIFPGHRRMARMSRESVQGVYSYQFTIISKQTLVQTYRKKTDTETEKDYLNPDSQ